VTTGIINYIIDFSRNHPEAFVVLLLSVLGSIFWLLRFIYNGYKRLNEIYVVRGKKSSSIDYEKLLKRPFPKYYELDEYQKLKEALKKDTHVLVVGAPLSGKTRAIYEVLKTKKPAANVIIPRARNIDLEKFEVPLNLTFWRKKILILDDIDKFIEIKDFKFMVEEFLKNNTIIIASCRSGLEFEKLRSSEWLISLFKPEDIIQFPENISDEKGKEIAKEVGVKWNPSEFDGKIGSLMMPLEIMKNRYTGSSPEEKAILRSIRLLYKTGIYQEKENFSINRILHLCKNLFGKDIDKHKFDEISPDLVKKNFIKIINDNVVWAEEAYLDFVIEAVPVESDRIDLFDTIKSYFLGDAEALFSLGNRAFTIGITDINKKYYMKVSIAAYEEALKVTTLDRFPMDYAMTQNNLGNAYERLAEVENKADNCKKSIAAYEEALKVRTLDRFPMQYATTQNNLGTAYGTFAEVENKAENCKKSIAAFEEALRVRTFNRFPMDYAMTQNNLGSAYGTFAEVENKAENCKKSIAAYQEALKIFTEDGFPEPYKVIARNLERTRTYCSQNKFE
jgi:tetratricopeptide (TPR) repeat protein